MVLEAIGRQVGAGTIKPEEAAALVERHLQRIEMHQDRLVLTLTSPAASDEATPNSDPGLAGISEGAATTSTIVLPWTRPRGRPRCEVITDKDEALEGPDPMQQRLARQIITGRAWLQQLASGKVCGIEAIANREGRHARSIRATLSFAFLAPDIVHRIIDGDLPKHLTLTDIGRDLPMLWSEQRRMFGLSAARV